jgi:hypothetical protein
MDKQLAGLIDEFFRRRQSLYRKHTPGVPLVLGVVAARVRTPTRRGFNATAWELFPNGTTYEGLNYLLDAGFRGASQLSAWFMGVIDQSGYSAVSPSDTAASHAGWSELTGYSQTTRQAWSPGAAATGQLQVTSALSVTMTAARQVRGVFLASSSTKGGTAGKLYATAVLPAYLDVANGATFDWTYAVRITPSS